MRILLLTLLLPACAGAPGLEGIPVAQVAAILHGAGDEVLTWDVNRNGLIDPPERLPLALAIAQRILQAMMVPPPVPESDT